MGPMRGVDFAGQAVVVTGGTRRIGAGIARAFLAAGADVLVCVRTEPAEQAAWSAADGRTASFHRADLRDPEQASQLVQAAAADRFGRLDVLINNAGGAPPVDAATASPRFHAKVIELNLIAPQAAGQEPAQRGTARSAQSSRAWAWYGAARQPRAAAPAARRPRRRAGGRAGPASRQAG